jgi:flavin-dependent dehydrogenase
VTFIVGGGPAGSRLPGSENQRPDAVLDKSTFPRDKVCAGWITPATTDLLHLDKDEYSRGRVLQHISGFKTGMIGGTGVVTRYGRAISYGIRRSEFDHYLLKACGSGSLSGPWAE